MDIPGEQETFACQKFRVANLKPDRVVLLVGKRGTGKSVLMCDLMYHLSRNYDIGIAVSPTEDTIREFEKFMMKSCIYRDLDQLEAVLTRLIETMKQMQIQGKRKSVFIILDDCMFDKKILKSKAIRDVFMNGRHYDFLFVNCMQYVMDMGPDLRTNVDYVFALRENIPSNREKLQKYFFGVFTHAEDFDYVFTEFTQNNQCVVLDNVSKSARPEDVVFWYKAELYHPHFVLGHRHAWKLHYRTYKPQVQDQQLIQDAPIPGLRNLQSRQKKEEEAAAAAATVAIQQTATDKLAGRALKVSRKKGGGTRRMPITQVIQLDEESPEHYINAAQLHQGIPDTPAGQRMVAEQWHQHMQMTYPDVHVGGADFYMPRDRFVHGAPQQRHGGNNHHSNQQTFSPSLAHVTHHQVPVTQETLTHRAPPPQQQQLGNATVPHHQQPLTAAPSSSRAPTTLQQQHRTSTSLTTSSLPQTTSQRTLSAHHAQSSQSQHNATNFNNVHVHHPQQHHMTTPHTNHLTFAQSPSSHHHHSHTGGGGSSSRQPIIPAPPSHHSSTVPPQTPLHSCSASPTMSNRGSTDGERGHAANTGHPTTTTYLSYHPSQYEPNLGNRAFSASHHHHPYHSNPHAHGQASHGIVPSSNPGGASLRSGTSQSSIHGHAPVSSSTGVISQQRTSHVQQQQQQQPSVRPRPSTSSKQPTVTQSHKNATTGANNGVKHHLSGNGRIVVVPQREPSLFSRFTDCP